MGGNLRILNDNSVIKGGKIVKRIYVSAMVLLMAAVLALPGVAQSAMWVGGEIGGNIIGNSDLNANASTGGINANATINNLKWDNPTVIGGVTFGYDFVNSGFGGYAYPDWMKYFSIATDFTYNNNDIRSQNLSGTVSIAGFSFAFNNVPLNTLFPSARIKAYMAAWTFMFMAHYGFLPDSEVPGGRLIPYVGVGPAILWSGIDTGGGSASGHRVLLTSLWSLRAVSALCACQTSR